VCQLCARFPTEAVASICSFRLTADHSAFLQFLSGEIVLRERPIRIHQAEQPLRKRIALIGGFASRNDTCGLRSTALHNSVAVR
jgi:hypothetical protein